MCFAAIKWHRTILDVAFEIGESNHIKWISE